MCGAAGRTRKKKNALGCLLGDECSMFIKHACARRSKQTSPSLLVHVYLSLPPVKKNSSRRLQYVLCNESRCTASKETSRKLQHFSPDAGQINKQQAYGASKREFFFWLSNKRGAEGLGIICRPPFVPNTFTRLIATCRQTLGTRAQNDRVESLRSENTPFMLLQYIHATSKSNLFASEVRPT